jgi:hypothetical protein
LLRFEGFWVKSFQKSKVKKVNFIFAEPRRARTAVAAILLIKRLGHSKDLN